MAVPIAMAPPVSTTYRDIPASPAFSSISMKLPLERNYRPLPTPPTSPPSPSLAQPPEVVALPRSTPHPPMRNRSINSRIMHARRHSSLSVFSLPARGIGSDTLLTMVTTSGTLSSLLSYLSWRDFLSLAWTCRQCWRLLRIPSSRDAILSRFIPGFRYVLERRDLEMFKEVPLSLYELNLFVISQETPLHHYPVHALGVLSSILPSMAQDEVTEKYIALTEAHSRVVLLMQSLAHSSSSLPPLEPKEAIQTTSPGSGSGTRPDKPYYPKELSFPAPLSYTSPSSSRPSSRPTSPRPTSAPPAKLQTRRTSHAPSASLSSPYVRSSTSSKGNLPRPSTETNLAALRTRKSSSIFRRGGRRGGSSRVMPPPPSDPKVLKIYGSSWRRTLFHSSGGVGSDDEDLPIPMPSFRAGGGHGQFASSSSSVSSVSVGNRSFPSSPDPSPIQTRTPPYLTSTSPHDITLASSRLRAPILRVFHPCLDMSPDSIAVQKCEDQLLDSGLWEHLSTGDIVVNLGYIPPTTPSVTPMDDSSSSSSSGESLPQPISTNQWLLFNGEILVPYSPPYQPFPLTSNPLSLPSPFYYSHIFPSPSTMACNPAFFIPGFPRINSVPNLTLVHVSTKVPSPHSPEGFAWVKRYCWAARVYVGVGHKNTFGTDEQQLGAGWSGEWVVQGDSGTREGRKLLLDVLGGHWEGGVRCEIVRERSGGGRIWVRLLDVCLTPRGD